MTIALALIGSAHRLPAPITEENPTPAPKPAATVSPKLKAVAKSKPEVTARPTPKPVSYAGTWSGLINSRCGDVNYSGQLTLIVSADERIVTMQLGGAQSVGACHRNGSPLQWEERGGYLFVLQMNPDRRTAAYSCRWTLDGDACLASGILGKR